MTVRGILIILFFFIACVGHAQPVTIQISKQGKDDSTGKALFSVSIKNNSFQKFHVQDTAILQQYAGSPINSIAPRFEKKEKDTYEFFPGVDGVPGLPVPDPCINACCTCSSLKKGEQLQFNLDLLSCCTLKKGDYRVKVLLQSISTAPEAKEREYIFTSNYVYFSVK
ncbi:hypothetical protein [Paraflavitalea sp. CAU 1676]|uniref:hypothetical protein n=1 Tax=Paraflavitalea sp. CAU 1676 TaxID=3032598 RepID=UPI0023D9BF3D|nr:hypothetical protein [Paraflavitalea sp. CAU 1676]MDF2189538.1 hypothetical protein [Paraflavitalea sp. CAU 1676]